MFSLGITCEQAVGYAPYKPGYRSPQPVHGRTIDVTRLMSFPSLQLVFRPNIPHVLHRLFHSIFSSFNGVRLPVFPTFHTTYYYYDYIYNRKEDTLI